MKKLRFKGIEIEFDGNVDISIEGDKITVKGTAPVAIPYVPFVPYVQPVTVPYTPPGWPIVTCGTTGGSMQTLEGVTSVFNSGNIC